tara:strand:+ start:2814 stop:3716 length:903 start_codon:yes stop_codon:yes gene_type:complete
MNRAPAFQFYPDKYLAGTEHLSDAAERAYMRIMCWMWLHSETQYSMPNNDEFWNLVTKKNGKKLQKVRQEIMRDGFQLFKVEGDFIVSNGLRKEALKQQDHREKRRSAANARWKQKESKCNASASDLHMQDDDPLQCSPSVSPSPPVSVSPTVKDKPIDSPAGESCQTSQKRFDPQGPEIMLSRYLAELMRKNNPDVKITDSQLLTKWPKQVDLMLRVDKRKKEDIGALIEWSQQDMFWQSNILSMAKVRKHFDKLILNSRESASSSSQSKLHRDLENINAGVDEAYAARERGETWKPKL